MDLFAGMDISASGLSAQRLRMNLIASNLANVNSTRTEQGGPYRRRMPVFGAAGTTDPRNGFGNAMDRELRRVQVSGILEDSRPGRTVYEPSHPDANPAGYVTYPNVNLIEEMADLITASRSYEANATVISTFKSMALKALEIGR
ncbi:MAG TPA: flagellar basal body rod protein FlgC [bacterium]|nr:flagellar basal body rod protein FlgC [bacterium]